jgi:homoserine dehydrogenase
LRIWLVGFGTVGRWLGARLAAWDERDARAPRVVAIATARDGFVHADTGIDPAQALALVAAAGSLAELPGTTRFETALEGMRATGADLLVEVTGSPPPDGEPGLVHIREALGRGIPVATSNKWPVAAHGVELVELARASRAPLRAESTVMSGTPVLGPLREGLAGARPTAIRGVLNATANFILTRIAAGAEYEDALAEAQAAGLAERDPAADVEGHDTVAKVMVLAGLVFGHQLWREVVEREGIAGTTRA